MLVNTQNGPHRKSKQSGSRQDRKTPGKKRVDLDGILRRAYARNCRDHAARDAVREVLG